MPKYTKRHSNKHLCPGTCVSGSNCLFITKGFGRKSTLENHLGLNKHKCPICFHLCFQKSDYYRHFRKKHKSLVNEHGGCLQHDVPNKKPKLKPPSDVLPFKSPFRYLKRLIHDCIRDDHRRVFALKQSIQKYTKKLNQPKVKYYTNILNNYRDLVPKTNTNVHELAIQWLRYLIKHNRMDTFEHESGLIFAYQFKHHGGLFQISLDRRNNNYPHFDGSLNAFQNVRDVPLCLNTACNPMIYYPDFKQAVLDQIKLPCALNLHKLMHRKSICYRGIGSVWGSKRKVNNQVEHDLLKEMFVTFDNFKSYCLEVLKKQEYKCAISGIYLLNGPTDTMHDEEKVFSMSINAIDPTLGHVKGNIEWVCRFINVTNTEKKKTYHHEDDPPNAWTKELFQKYFLG